MELQPIFRFRPGFLAGSLLLAVLAGSCGDGPREAAAGRADTADPPGAHRATLEQLLRDREATRHPSDGGGRAWLESAEGEPAGEAEVSGHRRWTLIYETGPAGIAEGGAVRFIVSPFWNWSPPQIAQRSRPGYTTVETDAEGIELELSVPSYLDIRIRGRALVEGERIRIVYGAGEALAQSDRFAEHGERFRFGVDGDGDRIHKLIRESPSVDVVATTAEQLQLLLPGSSRPGETVVLRVVLLDRSGNAGYPFQGTVELKTTPAWEGVPASLEFEPHHRGLRIVEVETGEPGVYRVVAGVAASDETGGVEFAAVSNPLLVEAAGPRILWGDLHGHSAWSDGTGTPEDYLRYARDVAGLDVVALTDHDHWGFEALDDNPEAWEAIQVETNRFNQPGHFVALLGYEWTNWIHGHRHVLYFEQRGKLLSSLDPRYDTPQLLWDGLRGEKVLTFAHHSAGGPIPTNWEFAPDPELEPLTEIASVHGSSESEDTPSPIYNALPGNWVRDALGRGYRLGFVGSGDSHDGHPGLSHLASGQGGLVAILAPARTREDVYEALRARRTYATNGPRILLRAALAGQPIGSELDAPPPGEPAMLWVRVIACAPLRRVDLIRSGQLEQSVEGNGVVELSRQFELTGLAPGEYVYVRAIQEDGGTAWSTPFFVN